MAQIELLEHHGLDAPRPERARGRGAEQAGADHRDVGDRRAREILFLCEEVPARQAADWGLVNHAVPAAGLDAKVDELVEKLAAKLPQTVRYTKQQLNWWRDVSWHETVNHARDWLALSMLGDEARDAIQAFLASRR